MSDEADLIAERTHAAKNEAHLANISGALVDAGMAVGDVAGFADLVRKLTADRDEIADMFGIEAGAARENMAECIALQATVEELRAALWCDGTKSGTHVWRAGQWSDAREKLWCCRCAVDATVRVDAAVALLARTATLKSWGMDDDLREPEGGHDEQKTTYTPEAATVTRGAEKSEGETNSPPPIWKDGRRSFETDGDIASGPQVKPTTREVARERFYFEPGGRIYDRDWKQPGYLLKVWAQRSNGEGLTDDGRDVHDECERLCAMLNNDSQREPLLAQIAMLREGISKLAHKSLRIVTTEAGDGVDMLPLRRACESLLADTADSAAWLEGKLAEEREKWMKVFAPSTIILADDASVDGWMPQVEAHRSEVDRILEVVGASGALVTDLSTLGDFGPDEDDLEEWSAAFGVECTRDSYLWMIAAEIRALGPRTGEK